MAPFDRVISDIFSKVMGETKTDRSDTERKKLPASRGRQVVEIYTDGACRGNPGPGGYAAILKYGEVSKEISGCEAQTTNNRMELLAVIAALQKLKRACTVTVHTDSNYVVKGMTEWIHRWKKRNWMNAQKAPVLNRELWEQLLVLSQKHQIQWKWVKGHHGHPENERCDALARAAIDDCQ